MRLVASAVAALGLVAAVAGTASADEPTGITFWQADFSGQSVTYDASTTGCTTLPFVVHSEFNNSDASFDLYTTPDCSGSALHIPATDLHSFLNHDVQSFTRD
ncbi:hypothetical protein [Kutzneria kofuensis]|uniref:Beta/gamma crystallin n=1 Tax=Kutzneria kofuensis TaxID=103725 RepID=A0A7W9KRK3_9PSEU|nr:hypothetical protein [Kutzneria kofuensis]MBB5897420.1 hypothetical protein [Kutzneria kofuensis]